LFRAQLTNTIESGSSQIEDAVAIKSLIVIQSHPEVFELALNLSFLVWIQKYCGRKAEESKQCFDWAGRSDGQRATSELDAADVTTAVRLLRGYVQQFDGSV
jgi:hypothetical protein